MSELSSIISASVFVIVIILIMSEKLHLTIAALLGALILIFTHTITLTEAVEFISKSHATLVLFLV